MFMLYIKEQAFPARFRLFLLRLTRVPCPQQARCHLHRIARESTHVLPQKGETRPTPAARSLTLLKL